MILNLALCLWVDYFVVLVFDLICLRYVCCLLFWTGLDFVVWGILFVFAVFRGLFVLVYLLLCDCVVIVLLFVLRCVIVDFIGG